MFGMFNSPISPIGASLPPLSPFDRIIQFVLSRLPVKQGVYKITVNVQKVDDDSDEPDEGDIDRDDV